jgi:hypothetical protein
MMKNIRSETRAEWRAHLRRCAKQAKLDLADAERRRARVLELSPDGKYVKVEFYNEGGEQLIFTYRCFEQTQPSRATLDAICEAQRNATDPVTTVGTRQAFGYPET